MVLEEREEITKYECEGVVEQISVLYSCVRNSSDHGLLFFLAKNSFS